MSVDRPLLIVGGGPAGTSAALAAAEHGIPSTVVDEGFDLGGQIYRPPTRREAAPAPDPRGEALRRRIGEQRDGIEVLRESAAWGIFDGTRVAVTVPPSAGGEAGTRLLSPRAVVLAPGAHEWVPPFPGWTLPGVMTPGAAQVMVKAMGVAPGSRVLVAGTGPFLLAVACQMVDAGVRVAAVLEASPRAPWLALPLHGWRTPGILRDGLGYLARLRRAGVPVRYGRVVVAAEGGEAVAATVHAPVDGDWYPDRGRTEREEVDALLVGFGFVPRADLARMAGCRLAFRQEVGGWVPERDRDLATTVPGIFAAGDGAGVAGVLVAEAEGRIAGLAAAARLGALDARALEAAAAPMRRRIRRLAPLRRALDRIAAPRPGLAALVGDDTLVCRCEEVPWSAVRAASGAGCVTRPSLRVATRVGMGACQGRFCWPSVARLVAAELRCPVEALGPPSVRPPVRPVTVADLAAARPGPP